MRGVWAVARHTFVQSLRMKIAGVFIALLAVSLAALPFMMKSSTLTGRIKTFLAYSTGVTSALLSLVTIFLAVAVVSSDVAGKQIFTIVTKPLSRWRYVLGRWLGVVLLDAVLLAAAGTGIYAVAMHMRGGKVLNAADRRAVETEIFTARSRARPDSFQEKLDHKVDNRIKAMKTGGNYDSVLEVYRQKYRDERVAERALRAEIVKEQKSSMQSVRSGGTLEWTFSGIRHSGKTLAGKATVLAVGKLSSRVVLRIRAGRNLTDGLIYRGPVRVNGVNAMVRRLGGDYFDAQFSIDDSSRGAISSLRKGAEVAIEIDPTVQITYRAKAAKTPKDGLRCGWRVENPQTGYLHYEPPRTDAPRLPATLTVSTRAISDEGKTRAVYFNLSPTSVTILHDDISLLYRMGGFGVNFLKVMMLMMCQFAFLAALGVLAATFLSFPVACLTCLAALPFSVAREFLSRSVELSRGGLAQTDFFTVVGHYTLKVASVVLPDFSATSGGDALVEGIYIGWLSLAQRAGVVVAVQTAAVLAIACLIFHKRELARIQA